MLDITPAPADMPDPPVTRGQRLAADLHALAELVEEHAGLAAVIAPQLRNLHVTLRPGAEVTRDDIADALADLGGLEIPTEWVQPAFGTRAWSLPAGAMQLTCTQLSVACRAHGL